MHTKGPWKIIERTERVPLGNRGEQTRHFLAIEQDIDSQFPAYIARIIKDSRSHELTLANARLIKEAPALLLALGNLLRCSEYKATGHCQDCVPAATEAIRKARGE